MSGRGWPLALAVLAAACPAPKPSSSASEVAEPEPPESGEDRGRLLSPEEGGFAVTLPASASEPARSVLGDNHLEFSSEVPGGAYTVEVIYKRGGIQNADEFLARMETSLAEDAQVISRADVTRGEARGWAMQLQDVEGQHSLVELLVTSHRTYLLVYASADSSTLGHAHVRRFFSSFEAKPTTGLSRRVQAAEGGFEVEFAEACGPAFKRVEMVEGKVYLSYVSGPEREDQCTVTLVRVDPLDSGQVFDAALEGALGTIPGAVVDDRSDSTLAGQPRRTVRLHATVDGLTLHMRADFVHRGDSLYQLQYVSSDEARVRSPEADAFFESFRLGGL